jgi:ADP-dependent NAD(P)H-hydrate dehydratase / NAD(P)H-hydrate epimerase
MKILTADQIRKVDAYTIEHEPVESIELMERAANKCFNWINDKVSGTPIIKFFIGPGNNGGDGLAIARLLAAAEKKVQVLMIASPDTFSKDAKTNYNRLVEQGKAEIIQLAEKKIPKIANHDIIIDAMFGSGLSRPLSGLAVEVAKSINSAQAKVISIDVPSGLYCESNELNINDAIVHADDILTFQLPKLSFFFVENEKYVGTWHLLDIGLSLKAIAEQESPYFFVSKDKIGSILKPRKKFAHKGVFGHALLLAGSYGKMGAAVLASRACLRTGVGLLTTHIPIKGYDIMQISVPEAMVSVDTTSDNLSTLPDISQYTAIGIGPGLGLYNFTGLMMFQLLKSVNIPFVLDADAINLLAIHPEWLGLLPENTILTPHPGEFDRMAGPSKTGYERHLKQIEFSRRNKVIVVLKGAYTSITTSDGKCWFNSTGNPGMATAGSGDVLTGIILSLLAQHYKPIDAALIGVYIHGLAGDLASADGGEESLIASDITNYIGKAFLNVKKS